MSTAVLGLSGPPSLPPLEHPHRCPRTTAAPLASPDSSPASWLDPRFVFDFRAYDDLDDGQRWSTWLDVEPLCRGPEPRPDWVVTAQGAIDTELGILKTGKEADVFLLERAVPTTRAAAS